MNLPPTANDSTHTSLTQGQQLLWTGQQLSPDTPLYNMAFVFWLAGPVDPDRFKRAFQALIDQCDALRTVVEAVEGVPLQRVLPTIDVDEGYSFIDSSQAPDPIAAAERWSEDRCRQRFELDRRLFDTALIKLGVDQYAWYFNQHHVVCDAWSVSILFDRLAENYGRLSQGDSSPPPPAAGVRILRRL